MAYHEPSAAQGRRALRDRVGNGHVNHPDDIRLVKAALNRLGRYRNRGEAHGYIDRCLHDAILGYQRDRGLRRDGALNPLPAFHLIWRSAKQQSNRMALSKPPGTVIC